MTESSRMVDSVDLSRLIGLAYEAPLGLDRWRDFTSAAAEVLHSKFAMIHHMDHGKPVQSFHLAGGIDESFNQAFTPRWLEGGDDIYLQAMHGLPAGAVRLSSDIVAPEVAHQTEIHHQLAAPWQLEHFLFASLGSHGHVTSVLSLGRCIDDQPFDTADIDLLTKVVLPHLCRSISLHSTIADERNDNKLLAAMINLAPCGIVALDGSGYPLFINETAAAIFSRNDGLTLQSGKLHCADSQAQGLLNASRLKVIANDQGQSSADLPATVLVQRMGKAQPYRIVFSPCNRHTGSGDLPLRAACVVLIDDRQHDRQPELSATLIATFSLSKAETRLCKSLLTGKTMQEASAALNISHNTAKTHLSRIFHKTGVHSQTALLHLITTQSRA